MTIASLTPVRDEVSRRVQAQYETNPYPRWQRVPVPGAFPLPRMLRSLFPHADPAKLAAPDAPEILVAGCGTGRHAAITAQLQPHGRVLAVDISRASLAYAMRRCAELGLANIRFAQADLLELGALEERFDLIECSGRAAPHARTLGGLARAGLAAQERRLHEARPVLGSSPQKHRRRS